jgi:hypothetical protein
MFLSIPLTFFNTHPKACVSRAAKKMINKWCVYQNTSKYERLQKYQLKLNITSWLRMEDEVFFYLKSSVDDVN